MIRLETRTPVEPQWPPAFVGHGPTYRNLVTTLKHAVRVAEKII